MFRGCFEHAIDEKGRLSIPAKFRDALDGVFTAPLVLTRSLDGCLMAYPFDEWRAFEAKLEKLPSFHPDTQKFYRLVYSPAQECPLDKAGRILVPPSLREYAGLERQVVVSGMGRKFELWDRDRHQTMLGDAEDDFEAIATAMGDLGL